MKGTLLKWTNYWNGWQPRFFILQDGLLSYYSSEEEVNQGCKGSVLLAACDINVHPTDICRLDIVIPGEQHIYVRTACPTDRQQWLVGLGSAKAQGLMSRTRKTSESSYPAGTLQTPDIAKTKKSELRLYCDLLMQQVHSIKEAAKSENGPDVQKLDESTSLLTATCDTFIKTLDECLLMADASPNNQNNKLKSIVHSNSN